MVSTRALGALLLLTIVAYAGLWRAGFVFEDRNPNVSTDATAPLDNRGPWAGWVVEQMVFRPAPRALSNLTMRVQGWLHQGPQGYHAVNLLLHLANGALLWRVLLPLNPAVAVGATLLFLLHPINTEAVAYVSARPDLLACLAVLLTLWAAERDTWPAVLLVTLGGLTALLAKESAVVVLALLPLWLWYTRTWTLRYAVPLAVWLAAGAATAYRILHVSATNVAHPWSAIHGYTAAAAFGPVGYIAHLCASLVELLGLVVWPVGLAIDHDIEAWPLWAVTAAALAVVAAVLIAWRVRHSARAVTFAVAWLGLSLAPRALIPLPEYLAEHQLYLPLLGLWIALAQTAADLCERQRIRVLYA